MIFIDNINLRCIFIILDVPSRPKGPLEVIGVSYNYADLEWKAPESDGGSPITKYIIEQRAASRYTWHKSGEVEAKVTTFRAMNLNEGTEYFFRVIAVNAEGESPPLETSDATVPRREIGM